MMTNWKPLVKRMNPWNQFLCTRGFCSRLFVSNMSFYSNESDLINLFSPFGKVKDAKLVMDYRTNRPKGFGFISFESEEQAQKALKAINCSVILYLFYLKLTQLIKMTSFIL
ncbi:hypothetical protein IFM89_007083 [Coptis chinensis]|uniref:RRM domain-containing protein n=1 Tax=Coptis chinensis TaxID=261450 RepID=A0A835H539_9MAGN|nr:hypothetical protein IFM89_007083 [Coptis chinensis]